MTVCLFVCLFVFCLFVLGVFFFFFFFFGGGGGGFWGGGVVVVVVNTSLIPHAKFRAVIPG